VPTSRPVLPPGLAPGTYRLVVTGAGGAPSALLVTIGGTAP
jgi:hypothetical protein